MKYCRNCGKELNSDVQYCPNCGASVSEEQSGKNENSYQESNAARIVTARIRFRLLRTRQRLKQKDTVWGAGAVECVCSVRLDYCAERFSRALK